MTDPNMVVHREAVAAWAVGPARDATDGGPAGEHDFEIVSVVTDAAADDFSARLPVVELTAPAGVIDERGAIHLTAIEAVEIAGLLCKAAQAAINQAGTT